MEQIFAEKVNVLGEVYTIEVKKPDENSRLNRRNRILFGFMNPDEKIIVIREMRSENEKEDRESCKKDSSIIFMKKVLRHEIVHAYLCESGLEHCSLGEDSWATNEEMVDWMAIQGPKLYKAWEEAGAL